MTKVLINIRIEESEDELLEAYCQQTGRTKTDVLKEYIRSLSKKVRKD